MRYLLPLCLLFACDDAEMPPQGSTTPPPSQITCSEGFQIDLATMAGLDVRCGRTGCDMRATAADMRTAGAAAQGRTCGRLGAEAWWNASPKHIQLDDSPEPWREAVAAAAISVDGQPYAFDDVCEVVSSTRSRVGWPDYVGCALQPEPFVAPVNGAALTYGINVWTLQQIGLSESDLTDETRRWSVVHPTRAINDVESLLVGSWTTAWREETASVLQLALDPVALDNDHGITVPEGDRVDLVITEVAIRGNWSNTKDAARFWRRIEDRLEDNCTGTCEDCPLSDPATDLQITGLTALQYTQGSITPIEINWLRGEPLTVDSVAGQAVPFEHLVDGTIVSSALGIIDPWGTNAQAGDAVGSVPPIGSLTTFSERFCAHDRLIDAVTTQLQSSGQP